MAELLVDPEDLRTAADLVAAAAAEIGHAVDGRSSDLGALGPSAWTAAATLSSAVAAWGPFLDGRRDAMRSSADNLRAMADAFVAAEWEAQKRHRRLGGAFVE